MDLKVILRKLLGEKVILVSTVYPGTPFAGPFSLYLSVLEAIVHILFFMYFIFYGSCFNDFVNTLFSRFIHNLKKKRSIESTT